MNQPQTFTCPCCGWDKLDCRPYKNMPDNPHPILIKPPYGDHWGLGSYSVCPCCGFEYGFDDNPGGDAPGATFQEHLREWFIEQRGEWFDPKIQPSDWDIIKQLRKAGIEVPDYIRLSRQLTGKH